MSNEFSKRSSYRLCLSAGILLEEIGDPVPFGFDAEELDRVAALRLALEHQLSEQAKLRAAYAAATTIRETLTTEMARRLARLAATATARESVTDEMLKKVGFAARPHRGVRPKIPATPTALHAHAEASGVVRLSWKRGETPEKTTYVIERQRIGEAWTFAGTTQRTRATLVGYAPGVRCDFRVTASGAAGASDPSPLASIYVSL